jgi:hypothetical protein
VVEVAVCAGDPNRRYHSHPSTFVLPRLMELLALLVGTAASIVSIVQGCTALRADQKRQLVQLFEQISDTIESAADTLSKGEVPHGSCATMGALAGALPAVLADLVPPHEVQQHTEILLRAHDLEQLVIVTRDNPQAVVLLQQAAGHFRAASTIAGLKRIYTA